MTHQVPRHSLFLTSLPFPYVTSFSLRYFLLLFNLAFSQIHGGTSRRNDSAFSPDTNWKTSNQSAAGDKWPPLFPPYFLREIRCDVGNIYRPSANNDSTVTYYDSCSSIPLAILAKILARRCALI